MTESIPRRAVLGLAGGALASLSGCATSGSSDECSPASFPSGNSTRTRSEPPDPCQFVAELEQKGLETDGSVSLTDGDAGVFYFHRPERHREDIRTLALTFVPYRRMVDPGLLLSFTALETNDDRHGVGHIAREWADARAAGNMTREQYVKKVVATYATR